MDEPNLNCANCYKLKREMGIRPMCEKATCSIEEIASDIEATAAADDLLVARQVLDANGMQEPYRQALSVYGFDEWAEGILRIEVQFARFKQRIQEQRERTVKRRKK